MNSQTATAKTDNRVRASASANRTKHLLFVLLFLAIPLYAGLFLLQQNIPFPKLDARIGQLDDGTNCVYWTDYQSGSTFHSGNPFRGKGSKSKLLDLQTGQVRSIDSYLMIDKRSVNTRGEAVAVGSKYSLSEMGSRNRAGLPPPARDLRSIYFKSKSTGEERAIEFHLPGGQLTLVNARYCVSADANKFFAVDLEDPTLSCIEFDTPYLGLSPDLIPIEGKNWFARLIQVDRKNDQWLLEVFSIESNAIQRIAAIPTGFPDGAQANQQLSLLSSDKKSFEHYDLETLQRKRSQPIDELFLDEYDIIQLAHRFLVGQSKRDPSKVVFYDFMDGSYLDIPASDFQIGARSSNLRYLSFHSSNLGPNRRSIVYDSTQRRIVVDAPAAPVSSEFLTDQQLIRTVNAYGVTVEVYNLDDGSAVRMRPYVQYLFTIIALGVLALLWWLSWLYVSAQARTPHWIRLTVLFGPWLLWLITGDALGRLGLGAMWFGSTYEYSLLCGIYLAMFLTSGFYLGSGTTRVAIRSLPLLITYITFTFIHALQTDTAQFTPVLLLPTLLELCAAFIGSIAGWIYAFSSRRIGRIDLKLAADRRSPRIQIVDLLALSAYIAVALAVSRPLFQSRIIWMAFSGFWVPTLTVAAVLGGAIAIAMLTRIWLLRWLATTLAVAIYLAAVTQEALIFAGWESPFLGIPPKAIVTIAAAAVACFTLAYVLHPQAVPMDRTNKLA